MNSLRPDTPRCDESGSAIIIALIVMIITVSLSLTAAGEALHSASSTALDRNQVQAIAVAEGGIDHALSALQGSSNLPCSATSPTMTVPLATTPVAASAAVTLTYYDTWPPTSSPDTTCTGGVQGGAPQAVEVVSIGTIGTSNLGKGTMDAMVRLTPYLADAIYANGLSVGNNFTLSGQSGQGDNANVYVAGSPTSTVTCPNNTAIYGALYVAQGAISLSNNCQVHGAVWANGSVTASNGTAVDGLISSTTSNISFSGSHAGGALAKGTISPACPNAVFGTCAANASVGPVPTQTFPQITYAANAAAWTAAGFSRVLTETSCATAMTDIAAMATQTTKTIIITPVGCTLTWKNNVSLSTGADVAIFASGGLNVGNSFSWASADSGTHNLYLIVPYTSPANCSSGGYDFNFGNSASFTRLNTVLYTPCNLNAPNNPISTGQLYVGATATINNNFSMTFQPETVPGVTTGVAYNVAMSYERQTSG